MTHNQVTPTDPTPLLSTMSLAARSSSVVWLRRLRALRALSALTTLTALAALSGCGGASNKPTQKIPPSTSSRDSLEGSGRAHLTRYVSSVVEASGVCEQGRGERGKAEEGEVTLRYLASRLGSDLRVHEYCRLKREGEAEGVAEGGAEGIEESVLSAGSCPTSLTCGVAYVHRDAAPEVGAYLALADLAQRLLPVQQSSLKERYGEELVGRESEVQTTAAAQSIAFQIKGGGRCVSTLKSFQDEMREERRYVGVETSQKEHSAVLTFQRVFFEERTSSKQKRQASLVLDLEAESNHEGALLQQTLSCELPNGLKLTRHPQLTFWSRSIQAHERVVEVSGSLTPLPPLIENRQ